MTKSYVLNELEPVYLAEQYTIPIFHGTFFSVE